MIFSSTNAACMALVRLCGRLTGTPQLAWDSYRRLIQGYAKVVAGLPREPFDVLLADAPLATAEVAGMGVACGVLALDSEAVKRASVAGTPAILVRQETVTTDIEGMARAVGILTATGFRTSHAVVVAGQLGKICLVACPNLEIDLIRRQCRIGGTQIREVDFISLDGNSGAVYARKLEPLIERPERALRAIADWRRLVASTV